MKQLLLFVLVLACGVVLFWSPALTRADSCGSFKVSARYEAVGLQVSRIGCSTARAVIRTTFRRHSGPGGWACRLPANTAARHRCHRGSASIGWRYRVSEAELRVIGG